MSKKIWKVLCSKDGYKKFFYTINQNILYSILKRYIKDKALLKLT